MEKKRYFSRFRIKAKVLSVIEFTEIGIINQRITKLCSNQAEADTNIFLTATFISSRDCICITIQAVDSDVTILALYYAVMLSKLDI